MESYPPVAIVFCSTAIEVREIICILLKGCRVYVRDQKLIQCIILLELSIVIFLCIKDLYVLQPVYQIAAQEYCEPALFPIGFIAFGPDAQLNNVRLDAHIHFHPRSNIVVTGESLDNGILYFVPTQREHVDAMKATAIIGFIDELLNGPLEHIQMIYLQIAFQIRILRHSINYLCLSSFKGWRGWSSTTHG